MFENLLRENIKRLVFDFSERKNYNESTNKVRLDTNYNPFGSPLDKDYNRLPDTHCQAVKDKLRIIKSVETAQIFIGNGIEEAIEILFRAFCEPSEDNIIICPPTSLKYELSAKVNNIKVKKVPLSDDFQLDIERIAETIDSYTKMIFLCSPNDPTGNALHFQDIEIILNNFDGIVALDESYINYSKQRSFLPNLKDYPNLVILQSLSHAWGLAGIPTGIAFADKAVIDVFNSIKTLSPIAESSQELIIKALDNIDLVNQWTKDTVALRNYFITQLEKMTWIERIFPSDANFILVKTKQDSSEIHQHFLENDIVLYPSYQDAGLENSLRISVGTLQQIDNFLKIARQI